MVALQREAWSGDTKTLLVAIDIGTTFTAASFSILEPGSIPVYQEVSALSNVTHFVLMGGYCSGAQMAQASRVDGLCTNSSR
jgi:hypothetical protein